jgi:hypothetical protein
LAALAFLTTAALFHIDDGPGYQPDCPVCNLERATGSEPATQPIILVGPAITPIESVTPATAQVPTDSARLDTAAPRGPPSAI